jgi:hypothetical protein
MATCKDCIHYNVCKEDLSFNNLDIDKGIFYENCSDFKNKADFVEVKHGEWKPTNIPAYFGGVIYECSLCGAKDGDHTKILGKYCWRCGAKMDGRRDT